MPFQYDTIVPWGRSLNEYIRMFALSEEDLGKKILGCGDGPAAFNSEMNKRGTKVVSIDPIYSFSSDDIKKRIDITFEDVIKQTGQNRDKFIWKTIPDVKTLGEIRMASMKEFLADFDRGKKDGRYIPGELPVLPFEDGSFDIALSSHFLFLYTDNLSLEFHIEGITEMLRTAKEVRIFPLLDVNAAVSPYVSSCSEYFKNAGFNVELQRVDYEFQKRGHTMMRIFD